MKHKLKCDTQKGGVKIEFWNAGTTVVSLGLKLTNGTAEKEGTATLFLFNLPEQLRVDKGDDVLQDLEC